MAKAWLILCCYALSFGQENPVAGRQADSQRPTFQSGVNLVLVPTVVRDRHGRPIGNLRKEDFQIFDNGNSRAVATFSVITRGPDARPPGGNRPAETGESKGAAGASGEQQPGAAASEAGKTSRHFVYVFDDLHIRFADMARVRAAALSHFRSIGAEDRAAILTISGRDALDFTGDHDRLEEAASKLRWAPPPGRGEFQCPDVSYYIADLVINKNDVQALDGLTYHTVQCAHPPTVEMARQIALTAANRAVIFGRQDTQLALSAVRRAIRRLAGLPGQRVIVLASPGFFAQTPEALKAMAEIIELAARNDVIINALSVRGVVQAPEEEDVATKAGFARRSPPKASSPDQTWIRYRRESAHEDGDVLNDMAKGTGGSFFRENNDLRVGFNRLAAAPEFSYLLGFVPSDLKTDGSYHPLKVRVAEKGATVEARPGYHAFAPDPKGSQARAELEDAVFARREGSDLPTVLQTGFSRPKDAGVAKVQVTAKIDLRPLVRDRPAPPGHDTLEIVVALFDAEGGFVTQTAERAVVNLEAVAAERDPAITLHWELADIKPSTYTVRFVMRAPRITGMTTINRELKVY